MGGGRLQVIENSSSRGEKGWVTPDFNYSVLFASVMWMTLGDQKMVHKWGKQGFPRWNTLLTVKRGFLQLVKTQKNKAYNLLEFRKLLRKGQFITVKRVHSVTTTRIPVICYPDSMSTSSNWKQGFPSVFLNVSTPSILFLFDTKPNCQSKECRQVFMARLDRGKLIKNNPL